MITQLQLHVAIYNAALSRVIARDCLHIPYAVRRRAYVLTFSSDAPCNEMSRNTAVSVSVYLGVSRLCWVKEISTVVSSV